MRSKLQNILSSSFGEFSWRPPPWAHRAAGASVGWIGNHRRAAAAGLLLLLACIGGLCWWLDWQRKQPRPVTIRVKAYPPGVTPVAKELRPLPLVIEFGASVAPLSSVSRMVPAGIRVEPPVVGIWRWEGDRRLVLRPRHDWAAAQKYRVALDRSLFPEHVLLEKYVVEVTTPPFAASVTEVEFYTDPTDPTVKQVVATMQFTHSVDPAEVERHALLEVIGGAQLFKSGAPRFTITPGLHRRSAWLRTSPLLLPEREDFMRVTLVKGLRTTQGGATTDVFSEKKVRVPDLYSFFQVRSLEGTIVRNDDGEPEQMLVLSTTTAARPAEIEKAFRVYLLPKKSGGRANPARGSGEADSEDEGDDTLWKGPQEIDEDVLKRSTVLPVKSLPSAKEHADQHVFKIALEAEGQLYATLTKGTTALGGFVLAQDFAAVLPVPELPREIAIQGGGGVLALNGERKLSVKSRGVSTIEYEIARVPADQINHLVTQTRGEFQNPEFVNYRFDESNIARLARERQTLTMTSRFKANFSAFDFSKHLRPANDGGTPMQGLFFLTAREVKPRKERIEDRDTEGSEEALDGEEEPEDGSGTSDRRFILVTDLGLIVKEAADGSRDVFISSIKSGDPVAGVAVEVLAKNGLPLLRGTTSEQGHVSFPPLGKASREATPVAFVARAGDDVAFMPFSRADRRLDFSRFDTGGVESASGADLDAFVFTDRGIYRPGDEIRAGIIVKQRDWAGNLAGVTIEAEFVDARQTSVQVRKLALPETGLVETSYQTSYESPSGVYAINVFLLRGGKRDLLLGSESVRVKEFAPDRMKIGSRLSQEAKGGWIPPRELTAAVTLQNLYGTPATDRRLKATLALSPVEFGFDGFPDFTFYDRQRDRRVGALTAHTVELGEKQTNDDGAATFDLQIERFADATYAAAFTVEGFEADSGRSVVTTNRVLVSPLPYVVGVRSPDDLSYIPKGSARTIEWIAIDASLARVAVDHLECRLIEQSYLSVLEKRDNGNWAYDSVLREMPLRTEPVLIAAEGLKYSLPTDVPGNYVLELRERDGARLSMVAFSVIGRGAVSRSLEKDAELEVKLARSEFNTGEEIEISVVAPYTGSGLITIEREKVYAHTWFKADQTSSVQRIRVPEGFEGTGYVNVCFVRALDSKEVLMSPLSYAAAPFQANVEKRRLPITLQTATKVQPGEPLRISYKTERPSRIAIFAVDEGILQVTGYDLPNPLAHFFRKAALMVRTSQIVDLILPEFSILRSAAAFGGDGESRHLNPFKRITEKPVVFWSGLIDSGPREREVVYEVPDYFSGTLTIMAVAVASDAVGSTETSALVRGPFVLTPNLPVVAAPGDQFEVSVTVANGVEGSGENAAVRVTALPSEHLEVIKSPGEPLRIGEGRESTTTFTVRAREKFGSASLQFRAATNGEESRQRSTMSVRPAVPFMTTLRSGNFTRESVEVKVDRALHPDFRKLEATVSGLPLGLARGLDAYLKNYPNGCSEQITSSAFCRLLLASETDFALSRNEVRAQMEHTFAVLRRRQNEHGSFGYWAADTNEHIDFVSVFVTHFLIEAKAAGFPPPQGLLQSALRHLQAMVVLEPRNFREARAQAYAIYLLTREGIVTTNYILNLRDYLEKRFAKQWPADLTTVYLAGACALLKKTDEAQKLVKAYRLGSHDSRESWDFHTPLGADSQYVAVLARHFPEMLKRISAKEFESLLRPIHDGNFNTLSAAYAVLALKSYSQQLTQNAPELTIAAVSAEGRASVIRAEGGALLKRANFSAATAALRFTAKNQARGIGSFYQVVQAGYDLSLPDKAVADGLEVYREFLDRRGVVTTRAYLGEPLTVRLRIRSLKRESVTNVAIVDLLPGGFEVARDSLQPGVGVAGFDYVEVREDRVVFFGRVEPWVRQVTYRIKPTNRGEFVVPPIFAESMYDRTLRARALPGRISVVDPQ